MLVEFLLVPLALNALLLVAVRLAKPDLTASVALAVASRLMLVAFPPVLRAASVPCRLRLHQVEGL